MNDLECLHVNRVVNQNVCVTHFDPFLKCA